MACRAPTGEATNQRIVLPTCRLSDQVIGLPRLVKRINMDRRAGKIWKVMQKLLLCSSCDGMGFRNEKVGINRHVNFRV